MLIRLTTLSLAMALMACTPKPETSSESAQAQAEAPRPASPQATTTNEGEACGGIAGIQCDEGLYCAMETGQCKVADGSGACKAMPEVCTEEYSPVCGCDGLTYSNACKAAAAGLNVIAPVECSKG